MVSYVSRRLLSQMIKDQPVVGAVRTSMAAQQRRCAIFDEESSRQRSLAGRVEKIEVRYTGVPGDATLIMNRGLSTPYECLLHVSEKLSRVCVLAEVDGQLWDLHRPLQDSCTLRCRFFNDPDPFLVNKAFWRSCSLMLGSVLETFFGDRIQLHSFPSANVSRGSFIYDARLCSDHQQQLNDTTSSSAAAGGQQLRTLSALMRRTALQQLPLQRLAVTAAVAQQIFADCQFKCEQAPQIAANSADGKVTLYRVGEFIDMSRGPVIGNTEHVGRCSITACHTINTDFGLLYRFQGVALSTNIHLKHFTYSILEKHSAELNSSRLPAKVAVV